MVNYIYYRGYQVQFFLCSGIPWRQLYNILNSNLENFISKWDLVEIEDPEITDLRSYTCMI